MRYYLLIVLGFLLPYMCIAQIKTESGVFDRVMQEMKDFKPDTTTPPGDKLTKKIIELRELRGGFNINEAIDFKIQDDFKNTSASKEELEKLSAFFKNGKGRTWLDNATIWIYRRHFSFKEMKQLVQFYKKPAGQKMAEQFPLIMLQTLAAGEMIKNSLAK